MNKITKVMATCFVFFGMLILVKENTISSYEKYILLNAKILWGRNGTINPQESESLELISQERSSYCNEKIAEFRQKKLNFVVILTNHQRWDTIGHTGVNKEIREEYDRPIMPEVEDHLVKKGVLFNNAFVSAPLCCAGQAGMLATLLQNVGYKTAFIGKYMNDHPEIAAYVPPGWTKFVATAYEKDWFNFFAIIGRSESEPSQGEIKHIKEFFPDKFPDDEAVSECYITNFQKEQVLEFLDQYGDSPFLLFFNTHSPHLSATPAPGDEELFPGYIYRGRAYGEKILKDKPKCVKQKAKRFKKLKKIKDEAHRIQLCALQAIDRAVGTIINKIDAMGKLDQTVFVFTSNNGCSWGEHRLFGQNIPYEESIRVPFVIVVPGIKSRIDEHLVLANLDIIPTIFELAGIDKETNGLSLVPLLKDSDVSWRKEFLIERFGKERLFVGLRTEQWKYMEYATGEKELYDLVNDPYETKSRHDDLAYQYIMEEFALRLEPLKDLAITVFKIPKGTACQYYEFQLTAWGGKKPYAWSIVKGKLPPGLSLDCSSGIISGNPKIKGIYKVSIKVENSSFTNQTGKSQSSTQEFKIRIVLPKSPCLTHGPMAGGVTSNSAKIWFRVMPKAAVQVKYSPDPEFEDSTKLSEIVTTSEENDYTGIITLNNLSANTTYYYRIIVDGKNKTSVLQPQFKTFHKTFSGGKDIITCVKIGVLTDFISTPSADAPAIKALSAENPDFVIILGDLDHRNPRNLEKMRAMHQETRGDEKVAGEILRDYILYKFPVAHVWDDHDYGGNNFDKTFIRKNESIQAYDEYWPSYERPNPQAGIWHKFSYSNLVEVIMLDLRSQRDPDTYKDPRFIPDNEPGANRDELRNDACRSMLDGDACLADYEKGKPQPKGQKKWLKTSLKNSTAKWKIIVSTVPWNPTTPKDDAWWDFKAEQEEILKFIRENDINGLIIISGDIHTGGAIDDGTHALIPEINVPTVNMRGPFCSLNNPKRKLGCGVWSHGFSPKEHGYGLITLTYNSALLEVKDEEGNTKFQLNLQ